VKRTVRKRILFSLVITVICLIGGLSWLLGTVTGASWLLRTVSQQADADITYQNLEGRLWDTLIVQGLEVRWPHGSARAGEISFSWQPLMLLTGNIAIKNFSADTVTIQDNSPEDSTPPDLSWPRVEGIPLRIQAWIDKVTIKNLEYRRFNNKPFLLHRATSLIIWHKGVLQMKNATLESSLGNIRGTLHAGLRTASLHMDITASPSEPVISLDQILLKARLIPGRNEEQVRGSLTLTGMSGSAERLHISGEIGITPTTLKIHELVLNQAGRQATLTGQGHVDFSAPVPKLRVSLLANHFDLNTFTDSSTDISGSLYLEGDMKDFRGEYYLSNKGTPTRTATLSGVLTRSKESIRMSIKDASWLGGRIEGHMQGSWHAGLTIATDLKARKINPAMLSPDWDGEINLNIAATFRKPEGEPSRGTFSGRLLESSLRGRELKGDIKADFFEENFVIEHFALQGKGFDMSAAGELRKRVTFHADISDLSGLVPGTQGELSAKGWIKKSGELPACSVSIHGKDLLYEDLRIGMMKLKADIGNSSGNPADIRADFSHLAYHSLQADSATVLIRGTLLDHSLKIHSESSDLAFSIDASGAHKKNAWEGTLDSLSGRDSAGPWKIKAPAAITATGDNISISPILLQGTQGEELNLKGALKFHPLDGMLHLDWQQIRLARANQWLKDIALSGIASGIIDMKWKKGTLALIDLRNTGAVTLTTHGNQIEIHDSLIACRWNMQGLHTEIMIKLAEGGVWESILRSSESPRLAIPGQGVIEGQWQGFTLAIFNPWLPTHLTVTGDTSGALYAQWAKNTPVTGSAAIHASGAVTYDTHEILVKETSLNLELTGKKLVSDLVLVLQDGGNLKGRGSFSTRGQFRFPYKGTLEAEWGNINLSSLEPWLPEGLRIQGLLSGYVNGRLLPDKHVSISGKSMLSGGKVRHRTNQGEISAGLRSAALSWQWENQELRGEASLTLAEHGDIRGLFSLPLSSRIPFSINHEGPLDVSVDAEVAEKGILSSLFPAMIRESSGMLELHAGVFGSWNMPQFKGTLKLDKAGAYIPSAGITLKEVMVKGSFAKDFFVFDTIHAASGEGTLDATLKISMENWKVSGYEGNLHGRRFRAVYLPELQLDITPKLHLKGSENKLSVKGEVAIPEMFIYGSEASNPQKPSEDVMLVNTTEETQKALPFVLDMEVHLVLGNRVFVKAYGVDTQLTGDVYITTARSLDEMKGKGLIQVKKGAYRKYGINLDIARGRLIFSGGPVDRPALDVLALRTVGSVNAGVTVSGTPQNPQVTLYSEPPMPDADILSYIVFGRPLGAGSDQASGVMQAAGWLLSEGESVEFQEKMKQTLGLDVLDIEADSEEASRSMLTVGKYLNPRLFVGYGQSLFGEGSLFRLRYTLSKHWEVETQSGEEMGGDLFYKIDFR
jgi:translocation and assembly module TamB